PTYRRFLCNHYMNLAVTLSQLGEHAEVAQVAERRASLLPGDPASAFWSYSQLRRCISLAEKDPRLSQPQRQAALTDYAQRARQVLRAGTAQQSSGNRHAVLNDLAWAMVAGPDPVLRDTDLAVEFAQQAVEAAPQEGPCWNTLGVARYRAGEWKAAGAALEKAWALRQGGDASDWFFLAMAHHRLGATDEAHQWYHRAVQWVMKNKTRLAQQKQAAEELARFQIEATAVLGIHESPTPGK